jgi:hypothetical protein
MWREGFESHDLDIATADSPWMRGRKRDWKPRTNLYTEQLEPSDPGCNGARRQCKHDAPNVKAMRVCSGRSNVDTFRQTAETGTLERL